jgi:Rrf2 family protein
MKVSAKSQYGLRALIHIAHSKDICSLKEIADKESISFTYLEKILSQLEKAGIIKSKLGTKGGYLLNKQASKIKMIDVIKALDSQLISIDCLYSKQICPRHRKCQAKNLWSLLEKDIEKFLTKTTLKDLIR